MTALGFGAGLALRPRRSASVAFDFSGGLPPGATLTRAGSAGRHDASGTWVVEAADIARLDHDPVTLQPLGVLIEPQRSNMLVQSSDLTAGAWTKGAVSTPGATQMIETAASAAHFIGQNGESFVAGTTYTTSFVVGELGTGAKRYAQINGNAATFGTPQRAVFDLASGALVVNGAAGAGIVALGGGLWRIWMTATATATSTGSQLRLYLSDALTATVAPSYAGDGGSGLRVLHAQIEDGAGLTSRIDSGAAAVTRAADVLTLNWASRGVADGTANVCYTFDDGSTQEVTAVISGGAGVVPVNLMRTRLRRAALL